MARHRITVGPPRAEDFDCLSGWFEQAGVATADPIGETARYRAAFAAGYLGVATGGGFRSNFEAFLGLPDAERPAARTMMQVLRLDDSAIGALVMGPHAPLWQVMDARIAREGAAAGESSAAFMNFVIAALKVTKIRLVVVDADQRGRGHGTRLLRSALSTADRYDLLLMYGQFTAEHTHLAPFYERAGFSVLGPGEPLPLALVTGNTHDALTGLADERFFVHRRTTQQ